MDYKNIFDKEVLKQKIISDLGLEPKAPRTPLQASKIGGQMMKELIQIGKQSIS